MQHFVLPDDLNGGPHDEEVKDDGFGVHALFCLNEAEEDHTAATHLHGTWVELENWFMVMDLIRIDQDF